MLGHTGWNLATGVYDIQQGQVDVVDFGIKVTMPCGASQAPKKKPAAQDWVTK